MSWSKTPPTEPGWYWWRSAEDCPAVVLKVEIESGGWIDGPGIAAMTFQELGGQWWQPKIEEPKP